MDGFLGVGPLELVVIFVVALLVFGPGGLPELARTVGGFTRRVRNASREFQQAFQQELNQVDLEARDYPRKRQEVSEVPAEEPKD
ncbi:Sec-independent protein translocase protein TatB [Candidatus Cyanaurora vandensis]|uniref:Sec-independent protein translocase protein TatB n=1 Tax=Candidatus Cyanaurora vandensis TaxID=2714958 RepID=UPI0025805BB0|nr:Sec-independent protein translocase protein TatB [Candidatus Cyanaurora vandensis]